MTKKAKMKPVLAWANVDHAGSIFDFMGDGHLDIYKTRAEAAAMRVGNERTVRVEIRERTK
jgi:hypothetical protein